MDGTWRISGIGVYTYGTSEDKPAPGDYNGDGLTDMTVFRPSNSTWYLRNVGSLQTRFTAPPTSGTTLATFVYDGDGKRVKSVINGETILFVGGHYEVKNPGSGQEVTKYYFAGTQRVAMRTGSTLNYLLGDHLGSTSIVTSDTGALVMETRYKPWGEVRSATASQTLPTRYTYTGQYSYINDEATDLGSAGFGLMFYNARWYDPAIGRFAQADTMIPGGVQGLDRYAYANNSPLNYVDPSGHSQCQTQGDCEDMGTTPMGDSKYIPERINPDNLDENGTAAYEVYLDVFYNFGGWWWSDPNLGGDGQFTVSDFVAMILYEESSGIFLDPKRFSNWKETVVRSFYEWAKGQADRFTSGSAGLLNYMWSQSGAETRTASSFDGGPSPSIGVPAMKGVVRAMLNPASAGYPEWAEGCVDTRPCQMGSHNAGSSGLSYINDFIKKNHCSPRWGPLYGGSCALDANFTFFLDGCDVKYWGGDKTLKCR